MVRVQTWLLSLSVFAAALSAQADFQKQKLLTVTKATDNTAVEVGTLANPQGLQGMYISGANNFNQSFTLADISSKDGVVLHMQSGFKVLLLKGGIDARTQEGQFTMSYLSNAIGGAYKSCDFLLRKDAQGWFVENFYTHEKPVLDIRVISHATGITTLEGICPKSFLDGL